jgi:ribosomal protein S18 acetylase RimI-like enzyme
MLRERWPALLFWGAAHCLVHPCFFYELVARLAGSASGSASIGPGYELRPIVVAPQARGTGIGVQLVNRLLGDAVRRGFERVCLVVEEDNATADAFYRKVGFRPAVRVERAGEAYLQYEYVLSSP